MHTGSSTQSNHLGSDSIDDILLSIYLASGDILPLESIMPKKIGVFLNKQTCCTGNVLSDAVG